MQYGIVILLVIICILWACAKKSERIIAQEKQEHETVVRALTEKLNILINEKEDVEQQNFRLKNDIDNVTIRLEKIQKELDFYKNIEEESGNLNGTEISEDQRLIDSAVQQIIDSDDESKEQIQDEGLLDKEQQQIYNLMEQSNCNLFITGKAGTGKSFLLNVFRETTKKKHIVLAPTGIAALNVKGATIHSAFGFKNIDRLDINEISIDTIELKSEKKMVLKNVSTIIIDEISMVRADVLERIDRILRAINEEDEIFGGKQMILFGDVFQLPPVAKGQEYNYLKTRFGGIYFFCANAYKNGKFSFYELTINHRQNGDEVFFSLLNHIRDGSVTQTDLDLLNTKVNLDESIYDRFTTLLPKKAEVEKVNKYRIDLLDSPLYVYQAKVVFDVRAKQTDNLEAVFPITNTLKLKKGALVMMVANDPNHRWVNGTLGIVSKLTEDKIFVSINKNTYEIFPQTFTEQEAVYVDDRIVYKDVLTVEQFPIVLAYAITIHKSQGQTYKNIVCDIEHTFSCGQAYVALSRCTSLEGLHLKNRVSKSNIKVDDSVTEFYNSQKPKRGNLISNF